MRRLLRSQRLAATAPALPAIAGGADSESDAIG